ncbi:MAG: response regulator transcription factor [Chloroflexi bacterium]|nr:response regulator transcription factor [Chloroflexota bacterium]
MPKTILVVDDEERIRTLLQAYLTQEGFKVVTAANGKLALPVVDQEHPDLILLDIMMPEMDGYEFLRLYSKNHNEPVILLTARLEESDKVVGLELGADDYVTKPFSLRELTARIRMVLRRMGKSLPTTNLLEAGDIILDRDAYLVTIKGEPVSLTRSEFDLLAALVSSRGRTLSRLQLLDFVQGVSFEGIERSIDGHIKNLRAKIEPDPRNPIYIETIYGVGYRVNTHRRLE